MKVKLLAHPCDVISEGQTYVARLTTNLFDQPEPLPGLISIVFQILLKSEEAMT